MSVLSRAESGGKSLHPLCAQSCLEVLQREISKSFPEDQAERIGEEIGQRFITRFGFSGPPPLRRTELDAFKFICKEFWTEVYGKKIDRLQTNHKGTFMFTDIGFPPLQGLAQEEALRYLALHRGMICGALGNLGIPVEESSAQVLVGGEGCCFTVKTVAAGVH